MKTLAPQRLIPLFMLAATLVSGCAFTHQDDYDGSPQSKIEECNRLSHGQKEVCLEHVPDKHEQRQRTKEAQW